jgi:hypothetical protein
MPRQKSQPQFTATVCFDVKTRLALGFRIGTEPPSVRSAALALQQALAWDDWGCPTEISIEADSHFLSTSMLLALADLDNGGAGEPDQES